MTLQSLVFRIILLYYALICHPTTASNLTYLDSRCSNNTIFAPNSIYQSNLKSLFLSLTSKAATNIAGNTTNNNVYGLYLCRGDLTLVSCKNCVRAATVDLSDSYCPLKKAGVIWYDECMVRYSNESFFGRMVESPKVIILNGKYVTGNETRFSEDLENTMNQLVVQAGNSMSKKTFFEKVEKITEFQTLRVFGQCTADLTGNDCERCLKIAVSRLLVGITGRVMQPSCNVFYEVYESNYSSPSSSPSYSKIKNRKGKKQLWTEVIVVTIIPVASIAVALVALCLILKKSRKSSLTDVGEDLITADSLQYNFATLKSATNNFSEENKLGQGCFGSVYKGTLPDGEVVAVKRLSKSSRRGTEEFKNEVLVVAKLQHRNLVRLLGFCLAGEEKLLVYEYVPNNSLGHFLFDSKKQDLLDWRIRYNIIRGIAKGMLYLHQDSRLRIIHRDLKASNVLLDGDMNPKISDFDLAEIFGVDQTQGNTSNISGTIGYISPEYLRHGQFSVKSDVYSFGVLVLEILSGKRISSFYNSVSADYSNGFLSNAFNHWTDNTPLEFVDKTIRDSCLINEVRRCMHLGLLCTQESIDQRPTMATVVLMLDSQSIALPMPEEPSFFISSVTGSKLDDVIGSARFTLMPWSINEISVSELEPR